MDNEQLLDYKTISTLDVFFSKVDLYQDVEFEIYKKNDAGKYSLDKEEVDRLLGVLDQKRESIDAYCVFCEKDRSFDVDFSCSTRKYITNFGEYSGLSLGDNIFILLGNRGGHSLLQTIADDSDLYKLNICYLTYTFTCHKKDGHIYRIFVVVIINKGKIVVRKIGQFPSKIDIWGFDFEVYKNQLNKFDAYSDFKKAELCMSDKLFAGAYTYLRRVFEKMLNVYCKGMILKDNRAETKIEACKDKFDERITPMLNNLYSILSKAIHELSDEESETFYVYLRAIIEMQLQHVKEINDREEQTKKLKSQIDKIAFEIK